MKTENEIEIDRVCEEYETFRAGYLDGYEESYKEIISGKPDGWCAWHPDHGYRICAVTKTKAKAQAALVDFLGDKKLDSMPSKMLRILTGTGWQVVPVKLLRCE